jgi:protein farnesyltransferase subunit beta
MSDAYHSCYVLSGLSSAQHQWELDDEPAPEPAPEEPKGTQEEQAEGGQPEGARNKPETEATSSSSPPPPPLPSLAGEEAVWAVLPYLDGLQIFDNADRVRPVHPVYAIPQQCVRAMREHFRGRQGF